MLAMILFVLALAVRSASASWRLIGVPFCWGYFGAIVAAVVAVWAWLLLGLRRSQPHGRKPGRQQLVPPPSANGATEFSECYQLLGCSECWPGRGRASTRPRRSLRKIRS